MSVLALVISLQIEETRRQLAALEQEESAVRVRFCQDHAQFLPPSLCPQIKVCHLLIGDHLLLLVF